MPSLLDSLLDLLEAETGLRASFDDLSGISLDYPQLRVSAPHAQHCSPLCEFAKQTPAGYSACSRDKLISNLLTFKRRRGFRGQCYLGLLDMVEPLIVAGRVLGVFYFGSVRLADAAAEERARRRIARFCARQGHDPAGYLEALERVPQIPPDRLPDLRERLGTVARTVSELCTAWAAPVERYRQQRTSVYWGRLRHPPLVQAALAFVQQHYGEPCQVRDLAARFRCHPDYLSRVFQQHTGLALSDYVRKVRLERARRMLASTALGIGEIGARCGYPEPAHFTRVFRQSTGHTPGAFRQQAQNGSS
jgi:AraC-like DNA-binding protein/ligand-binding sensor protein